MNKKTYLALVLAACMGVASSPLWAEVTPAPEQHPANIKALATSSAYFKSLATLSFESKLN